MLRYTASRKLNSALKNLEAPMQLINRRSLVLQDVIDDIREGVMSPDDGARYVLNSVYSAFDQQPGHPG